MLDANGESIPVLKFDKYGQPVWKYHVTPGGHYVNGRCVDWQTSRYVAQRHVLDYTPERHRTSKHARGRIRPRTAAEQTRLDNIRARIVQRQKSAWIDVTRLGAIYDDLLV